MHIVYRKQFEWPKQAWFHCLPTAALPWFLSFAISLAEKLYHPRSKCQQDLLLTTHLAVSVATVWCIAWSPNDFKTQTLLSNGSHQTSKLHQDPSNTVVCWILMLRHHFPHKMVQHSLVPPPLMVMPSNLPVVIVVVLPGEVWLYKQ